MQPLICNISIAWPIEQGVAKKFLTFTYKLYVQGRRQEYCWQLGGASPLSAPRSIPQNQGMTKVLPVLTYDSTPGLCT